MRVYSQEGSPSKDSGSEDEIARFSVLYAKSSTRKHKKWEGDGFLFCYPHLAVLKTDDLKSVVSKSTSIKKVDDLVDGFILKMGSLEVLIQERLSPMDSIYKPNVVSPGEKTATPFVLAANGLNVKKELKRKMDSSELDTPDFKKSFVCPVPGYSSTTSSNIVVQPTKLTDPPREIAGFFASNLRPHQVEGVIFIVKKLNSAGGGAILADEMGLGKTVQTLAAMYSLMGNKLSSTSDVRKVLLVVPSSLVNNWKAEFRKWFGAHRFPAVDVKKAEDVRKFSVGCKYTPFLLISYDMALRTIKILNSLQFDAIVCDEGHRLKNTNSKLRKVLCDLNIGRRLLLTGTPVQNDIDEFYSLLDFVRPGTFGTVAEFRKSQNDEESIDIHRLIKSTLLRRTSEINTSHLPPKNEYVVFCSKSPVQNQVYDKLCGHMTADHLLIIGYLRKLANHPALLFKSLSEKPSAASDYILSAFPNDYGQRPPALNESGKLHVLSEMLTNFRLLDECTVIVSNYVKTLDMIESLCQSIGMQVMRLDGGVAVQERQKIVDKFNKEKNPNNIFLLSTKAGGVGLNLIGASRLILFDSEWNPACDLQAMGRIWRDGQIRPCHIYRLCTAGSIDEKIFQRQVKKTSLSSFLGSSFDTTSSNVKFSDEELRDIYQNVHSASNTHDMLDCGNGLLPTEMDDESLEVPSVDEEISSITVDNIPENNENSVKEEINEDVQEQTGPASMAELFRWRHFSPDCPTSWQLFLANSGLKNSPHITFAFQLTSQF